ncbi:MAG: hypothetical protein IJ196_08355 [Prevotella sp.]|nr:hypothetical protein [Prevotella sp.]
MKKKTLGLMSLIALLSCALSGCLRDDSANDGKEPVSAYINFRLNLGEDLLNFYDVTGQNSDLMSYKMRYTATETEWTYTEESDQSKRMPEVVFNATARRKDNYTIDPQKEIFDFTFSYHISWKGELSSKVVNNGGGLKVSKADIEQYLADNPEIKLFDYSYKSN